MKDFFTAVLLIAGMIAVSFGTYLICPAAGIIVAGIQMIVLAVFMIRGGGDDNE